MTLQPLTLRDTPVSPIQAIGSAQPASDGEGLTPKEQRAQQNWVQAPNTLGKILKEAIYGREKKKGCMYPLSARLPHLSMDMAFETLHQGKSVSTATKGTFNS